jgi:hypothetical protein
MLDHLQPGLPDFLNMFLDVLWRDPVIRTRARELLTNNVAIRVGMQGLLQNQYPGSEQLQRAEQSRQPPFGDAARSGLAANFPPPNFSGSSSTYFIQNETPVQNNDLIESPSVQRQGPIQSTTTGPPSEPGQDIDTSAWQPPSEWTTDGSSGAPPIDDDWIQDYLGNTG